MNKKFMRKHVKQMPHVSGVKLELDDTIDVVIRGKHRFYRVKDAIEAIPCILKWRVENPHANNPFGYPCLANASGQVERS